MDFTTKLRLPKPAVNSLDWHYPYYDGMDLLDAHLIPYKATPPKMMLIVLSAPGSLTAARYYYYKVIAFKDADATNTLAIYEDSFQLTDGTNKTITIGWSAVTGATKYKVYRYDTAVSSYHPLDSDYLWYRDITAPTTSFVDDGTYAAPSGAMPTTTNWFINVGIGTDAAVTEMLHVEGNIKIPTSTDSVGQIKIGSNRFIHSYGTSSVFIGDSAGNFTLTGTGPTAVGKEALAALTSANYITAVGYQSGHDLTSGNYNTFLGAFAGHKITTGTWNVAVGNNALENIGGGSLGNTVVGWQGNTTSSSARDYNVVVGYDTGKNLTTGYNNTIIGATGGAKITTGHDNVIIGYGIATSYGNNVNYGVAIGYGANVYSDYDIILGGSSAKVGICTANPTATLHVTGTILASGDIKSSGGYIAGNNITCYSGSSLYIGSLYDIYFNSASSTYPVYFRQGPTSGIGFKICKEMWIIDAMTLGFGGVSSMGGDAGYGFARIMWATAEVTQDTWHFLMDTTSKSAIFSTVANKGKSFDHAAQTDPTIFIHSATDPDTNNTQWLSLCHDTTNGVFNVGTGNFYFSNKILKNINTPVDGQDAVNKTYVDGIILRKNFIIDANFDIWQRGISFNNPSDLAYLADHWQWDREDFTLPANITFSKETLGGPGEIANSYYFFRTTVDGQGESTPLNANALVWVGQKIEHGTRLICGNSKKVTVSFYAKKASSMTDKKIGIFLKQNYGTGGSPTADENINGESWTLSTSWTKYTHTFTTNTLSGKNFGTNNDDYLQLLFVMIYGTGNAAKIGTTGEQNFIAAGYIDIAQVQLNIGDVALTFSPRTFGEELQLCQRYYEKSYNANVNPGTNTSVGSHYHSGSTNDTSNVYLHIPFKVTKCKVPTVTLYPGDGFPTGKWGYAISGSAGEGTSGTQDEGHSGFNLSVYVHAAYNWQAAIVVGHWTAEAEL